MQKISERTAVKIFGREIVTEAKRDGVSGIYEITGRDYQLEYRDGEFFKLSA